MGEGMTDLEDGRVKDYDKSIAFTYSVYNSSDNPMRFLFIIALCD